MNQILVAFCILGVLQGLVLSFIFNVKRKEHEINRWLSALFLLLSFVTLNILVTNSGLIPELHAIEILEYATTFLSGPILYVSALKLLEKPLPSKVFLFFHFLPFIAYLLAELSIGLELPVIIPVTHLQAYTLWLVIAILLNGIRNSSNRIHSTSRIWILLLTAFLVAVHLAQWTRYFFSTMLDLELLIPTVVGIGFYMLTFYGLLNSSFFTISKKYNGNDIPENLLHEYINRLNNLVEKEQCYREPDLTLEVLAKRLDIHPNLLSRIINGEYGIGFNEFINNYRIDTAKKYLADPSKNYYSIEALGREAGFHSRSSFYAAFRKVTGATPSSYKPE